MRILVLALILVSAPLFATAEDLPRVLVMATGGTIAGEQREPGTLEGYEIRRNVSELVAAVPEIRKYARVDTEQFSNIPSPNMAPSQWLQLGRRINMVFREQPELAGIVVTHGTARLEETAFFLHLAVKVDRPVVVVGAQRPPTGISPDGALNLLSAIRVAASPEARGKGALVVMDEKILSARDAEKYYARNGGFGGGEMGMIGVVGADGPAFFYTPSRRHTFQAEFDVNSIRELPQVDIHYSYAGSAGADVAEDVQGVVVATTGFTPAERSYYENLRRRGVVVASTFPSGEDAAPAKEGAATVAVERLSPVHARILLMLALTKTRDPKVIQRIFNEY
jgi:L-asparaginase